MSLNPGAYVTTEPELSANYKPDVSDLMIQCNPRGSYTSASFGNATKSVSPTQAGCIDLQISVQDEEIL